MDVLLVFHLIRIEPRLISYIFFMAPKCIFFWPPWKPLILSFEFVVFVALSRISILIRCKRNRINIWLRYNDGICVRFQIRLLREECCHGNFVSKVVIYFGRRFTNRFIMASCDCYGDSTHILIYTPSLVVAVQKKTFHIKAHKFIWAPYFQVVFPQALMEITFLKISFFTRSSGNCFGSIKFELVSGPFNLA